MGLFSVDNDPKKIIVRQAKREFPNAKIQAGSYCELQSSLIRELKKSKENKLSMYKTTKVAI